MGKAGKWIKNFLTGKKEKGKGGSVRNQHCSYSAEFPTVPVAPTTPKENRRWSFRRSATASRDFSSMDLIATTLQSAVQSMLETENDRRLSSVSISVASVASCNDAVMAAGQPVPAVTQLRSASRRRSSAIQEAAAIRIQAFFRGYLARKALCALKGLVKLQALVRGYLVRKQAARTLRCMQSLVTVQTRARAQRSQMAEETHLLAQRSSNYRNLLQANHIRPTYNMDRHIEDNVKVVEMDFGQSRASTKSRNGYLTNDHVERADQRYSPHHYAELKQNCLCHMLLAKMSPNACSRYFDEYSVSTEQSSPCHNSSVSKPDPTKISCLSPQPYTDFESHDLMFFPNYMANTESFKAKARSQSAPKQRVDLLERQSSRKKISVEGRNATRTVKMQRSSSHVGSASQGHRFPWSVKLDRSAISLKDSECGSTSTVLSNANYSRSLAAYEVTNY